eukprot:symbB.v1.2.002786.t1/scaffold150.1/size295742/5
MATGDSSMGIAPEALCQIAVWTSPPRRKRFGRFMSDSGLQEQVVSPKQTALGIFRRQSRDLESMRSRGQEIKSAGNLEFHEI